MTKWTSIKIQHTLGEEKVQKLDLSELTATSEDLNQLLRLLDNLKYADDGLRELKFHDWRQMVERLND